MTAWRVFELGGSPGAGAPAKYRPGRAVRWVAAYIALSLLPLLFVLVGPLPAPRSWLVEFGVGLGFVGIAVLALQFVASGRFRSIAPVFGADVVLQFHRQAGVIAFALILAHPAVLVLGNADYLAYFDPRENVLRALALIAVIPLLILLLVTSLWRERFRLQYEWWRAVHGLLSLAVVFIGMVHGLQVNTYLRTFWERGVWAGVLVAVMYLVVHSRVIRPWIMKKRPYRVVEVREERGNCYTMALEPVGHQGMCFEPGQFAWLTVGSSPYSLQQHPFSFCSSAEDSVLEFTAKPAGDFTSTWKVIAPGTCVFLEGPYGGFTLDPEIERVVLIAGGIGVTPFMSMLRTMRDRNDRRPVMLFYGNQDPERSPFWAELRELEVSLELDFLPVLTEPPDSWQGLQGFIDRDLLDEHLPADRDRCSYYLCGPEPLMNSGEQSLRALGVSWRRIYTERFQVV